MKKFFVFVVSMFFAGMMQAQAVKSVGVAEFAKGLNQKNIQLIDVRTPEEYSEGYIINATLMNWNNQEQFVAATRKLDKSKPVYVYCLGGVRSMKAAEWLAKNGFDQIYSLEGGIKAWKAEEKPLVKP